MNRNRFANAILFFAAVFTLASCGGGGGGGGGFFLPSGPAAKPGAFNLLSPGNNDTSSLTPALSWTASSEAANYTVQVTDVPNTSFSAPLLLNQAVTSTQLSLVSLATLTNGNQYIWRVIANNSKGTTLATAGTNSFYTFTAKSSGGVNWAVVSDPTGTGAEAFAVALDSGPTKTYMYVVGYDTNTGISQNDQWRIEKRSLFDGSLVSGFGANGVVTNNPSNGWDDAYGVVTDPKGLYIVGSDSTGAGGAERWRIERRDLTTGSLTTGFGTVGVVHSAGTGSFNTAFAAATDGTSLFVVGYDTYDASNHEEWRFQSFDLLTGAPSTPVTSATGTGLLGNEANAIVYDSAATALYIAGYDSLTLPEKWRIEKRDVFGAYNTGFGTAGVVSLSFEGYATTLATNPTITAVFVAGTDSGGINLKWRIAKLNKTDGLLDAAFGSAGMITYAPSTNDAVPLAMTIDGNSIYIAGYETVASGDFAWRIEKRDIMTGALDPAFGNAGSITYNPIVGARDVIWGVGADASALYLVGYDSGGADRKLEWRIEKRSK